MTVISELVLRYAAVGADQVARADEKVRDSTRETGKAAKEEEARIRKWLDASKASLAIVGATLLGIVGGLIAASPLLTANMASIRLGLGLLADELLGPLLPLIETLTELLFDLTDAYAGLPEPVRLVVSGILLGVGALGLFLLAASGVLAVLKPLIVAYKLIPTTLAPSASLVYGLAAAIGVLIGLIVVWILKTTGVLDALDDFGRYLADLMPKWAEDAIVAIFGVVAAVGAFIVALVSGEGLGGAFKAFQAQFNDWLDSWGDFLIALVLGIRDLGLAVSGALVDFFAWIGRTFADLVSSGFDWGADLMRNFADGILSGLAWVSDAAQRAAGTVADWISFDIAANDAMAAKWGADLAKHFGTGLNRNLARLDLVQPLASPVPGPVLAAAGGGNTTINNILNFAAGSIVNQATGNGAINEDRIVEKVVRKVSGQVSGRTTR